MTVRFEHETRIEAPMELVFDLSLNIDAHCLTQASAPVPGVHPSRRVTTETELDLRQHLDPAGLIAAVALPDRDLITNIEHGHNRTVS